MPKSRSIMPMDGSHMKRTHRVSTHRVRRVLVPVAVAGAILGAAQLPVLAAPAATPTVQIGAQTAFKPFHGFTIVDYHSRQGWVHVSGRVSGAVSGEIMRLYAQKFPFKKPFVQVARPATVRADGNVKVTFDKLTPHLATRYKIKLFADRASVTPLAVSDITTIYVVGIAPYRESNKCPRPDCTTVLHVRVFVPPSTMRIERAKRIYTYFAVNLSPSRIPPPPRFLHLGAGHPRITGIRKVAPDEYRFTLKFTFRIGNDAAHWGFNYCVRDTLRKDGLGLPRHFHCGDKRILRRTRYLG